ncbi:RING finger protein 212B-like isoform X1 [Rhinichthys klamathensis goyatoka]|uniref:RING finger protein 212B-like isoform X1 n=1 Tax=Rhinichthys klamathensis goyatoka TaxID=3034132 RepID=UPI0024B50690|nr:RING finger protein 212B-like isoform X1 [Rhinichthys klamathensis goyatoka]
MNWFHCNNCFVREGKKFVVSSCGHIFCENCVNTRQCRVCHANCNYLHISDQMKPQEKMFFKDPVKLIQTRLEHFGQIANFQKRQMERVIAFLRSRSAELERKLKEVCDQCDRRVSELKLENEELKKPLSQRRTSPGRFPINGGTPRMILPVAVTSPVTPRSRAVSLSDTLERFRHSRLGMTTPPGSSISMSGMSSVHEHGFRTPSSVNTPTRSQHTTPNNFQLRARPTLQSPRP